MTLSDEEKLLLMKSLQESMASQQTREAEETWEFLTTGRYPWGTEPDCWIPLSPEQAMAIIVFLQEHLRCLSDSWELCSDCKRFFNTARKECFYLGHKLYCEDCGSKLGFTCADCGLSYRWQDIMRSEQDPDICKRCAGDMEENKT